MSTPSEPDARSPRERRWTQPSPARADQNIKLVQRKIDQNLKPGQPGIVTEDPADRTRLPGSPGLMAQLAQPGHAMPNLQPDRRAAKAGAPTPAEATEPAGSGGSAESDDVLAKAWEERMAKQWEDVTTRLCREFAPAGGADTEIVLNHIEEQRRNLDSATVRDYLPVLVERAVRRMLAPED